MHRRSTDTPGRRREDELEELLQHGSRNFRRYRRRATLAFAILTIGTSLAIYLAVKNGREGREAVAAAGARVTVQSCQSVNELQAKIVRYVVRVVPREVRQDMLEEARRTFAPRDCDRAAEPLTRARK